MTPEELTAWRREMGVSQARLAQELGVSQRIVGYWETDTHPTPPLLRPALQGIRRSLRGKLAREAERRRKAREEREARRRRWAQRQSLRENRRQLEVVEDAIRQWRRRRR